MAEKGNPGIQKLAATLTGRMKKENESPLVLDFGIINADFSLETNTFPIPIPKNDYTVCRSVAYGKEGSVFEKVKYKGENYGGEVPLPKTMKSIEPGDSVLVAWVQNEAVVIDVILSAAKI